MNIKDIFTGRKQQDDMYYENSTQKWLPIKEFRNGIPYNLVGYFFMIL